MADDAGQFGQDHAQVFGALRRADSHQGFHREDVAEIVAQRGDVIQAVGERNVAGEGVAFADFLVAAVQVPHDRFEVDHILAVQQRGDAKDAVRGRVLRAEIDRQQFRLQRFRAPAGLIFQRGIQRPVIVGLPSAGGKRSRGTDEGRIRRSIPPAFRPAGSERFGLFLEQRLAPILAQGMPRKALPKKNPAQIRMPFESNTEEIPDFALLEFGARVDCCQAGQDRIFARHAGFEHFPRPAGGSIQMIDRFEPVFGEIIHSGDRREIIIFFFVAQCLRDGCQQA